jgi:hypothetical protein
MQRVTSVRSPAASEVTGYGIKGLKDEYQIDSVACSFSPGTGFRGAKYRCGRNQIPVLECFNLKFFADLVYLDIWIRFGLVFE